MALPRTLLVRDALTHRVARRAAMSAPPYRHLSLMTWHCQSLIELLGDFEASRIVLWPIQLRSHLTLAATLNTPPGFKS